MTKTAIIDIETDGLLDDLTKIHCATVKELNGCTVVFRPQEISKLPEFLQQFDMIVGHNILAYDLPAINKILNFEYKGRAFDTLLACRILFPDQTIETYLDEHGKEKKAKSKHSLENYGLKLGISKPKFDAWDEFSEEMMFRNIEDVRITEALYSHILTFIRNLQKKDPRLTNFKQIFDLESTFLKEMEIVAKNGWLLDTNLLFSLEEDLSKQKKAIDDELQYQLPMQVVRTHKEMICKAFKKDGKLTSHALSHIGIENEEKVGGDFCRVRFEPMNLGSSTQLKEFLLKNGWVPTEYNFKKDKFGKPLRDENKQIIETSPKVPKSEEDWEEIAEELNIPTISLISKRAKIVHRLGLVKGYIENMRTDKRLQSEMITVGAVTQRVTHRVIANVPKADENVFYGKEMRSLFICPENRVLVGCDASALEARCLAHYLYSFSKEAALELIEGDVHTKNAEAWGVTRSLAKNGKYALAYGCAPAKLAKTLKKSPALAKELYDTYWSVNKHERNLKTALERQWEKFGYLVSIDGRPLTIRAKHALLNTLLQSCGIILMKIAFCYSIKEVRRQKLDAFAICHYHDEYTYECSLEDADKVMRICEQSIEKAGKFLKMNVAMTGEAKKGKSWAAIH